MTATDRYYAPVAAIGRHRLLLDGQGITTLVVLQGCPLRCKLCVNPYAIAEESDKASLYTPETLYEKLKIDELYFLSTGGGVTFGGGEPLLYPSFIRDFRRLCGNTWHLCVETSLCVPWENVEKIADVVDTFYFDCKDTNPDIYGRYTGRENTLMLENIEKLAKRIPPEKIVVRIPLIPGYNARQDQEKSVAFFTGLGLCNFDLFTYRTF